MKTTDEDWRKYYKKTSKAPASPLLEIALENNPYEYGLAYDLGCGTGRDSLILAKNNWNVISVDKNEEVLNLFSNQIRNRSEVQFVQSSFEDIKLQPCQLIHGSYSFPFCNPRFFKKFWRHIHSSLQPGGTLSGHLFGNNDEWSNNKDLTFHSHKDWDFLMKDYEILFFDEIDQKGLTASGETKHWHLYSFVLQKPA